MHPTTLAALLAAGAAFVPPAVPAQDRVFGQLLSFRDNGAWSWFEDERAVVDPLTGRILVGSCADGGGLGGLARSGDIDVAWLDVPSGRFGSIELHDRLQGDDHDSPALLVRPDGRYLAMYAKHGSDNLSRWRVSAHSGDPTLWSAEAVFTHAARATYANLFHLAETGRTYNFVRAVNLDPNVMVSLDQGSTWSGSGKLLTEGGGSDRPYLKYASDGRRRIHVLATERHPHVYDNSIYHGYMENDALHDSFGNVVDADVLDGAGRPPSMLTAVFRTGTSFGGTVLRRAWTIDVAADDGGVVRALFQARARDDFTDHRLCFARFDGGAWTVHEVCALGSRLYAGENDYTGLAALHPDRADTIYVSTPIDPRTGAVSSHHEIFEARTADRGASWSFVPVTEDSTVDNLRPIVPAWDAARTALLWLRGSYRSYTDYDLAVVGRIEAPELAFGTASYHDAVPANTTLAIGGPANPTGPAAGQGADDDRWHLRTGFGNGDTVWTASENGSEDAPMLRTRLTGLAPGVHDVFVLFWSNPNNDWSLRAGFDAGELRNLEKRGAAAAEPSRFVTPPVVVGSTVRLYAAWLGRAEIAAGGTLDVLVDDFDSGQGSTSRSWYDGIAVAPAGCGAATQRVGAACGGSPDLVLSAAPRLGVTVAVSMTGAAAGAPAAALFGGGVLRPVALAPLGFADCVLLVDGFAVLSLGVIDTGGASAQLRVTIPNDAGLSCRRFAVQGAAASAAGVLQLTPALVLVPGS